jgi:hypothetical protein
LFGEGTGGEKLPLTGHCSIARVHEWIEQCATGAAEEPLFDFEDSSVVLTCCLAFCGLFKTTRCDH